jgi:hypothetical protein
MITRKICVLAGASTSQTLVAANPGVAATWQCVFRGAAL